MATDSTCYVSSKFIEMDKRFIYEKQAIIPYRIDKTIFRRNGVKGFENLDYKLTKAQEEKRLYLNNIDVIGNIPVGHVGNMSELNRFDIQTFEYVWRKGRFVNKTSQFIEKTPKNGRLPKG